LAALVLIVVIFAVSTYNGLVNRQQGVDAAWAQVQNVYQRRADLIPNLVNTVSGAANFEKSTLTEITAARASVGQLKIDPNTAPSDPAVLEQFQKTQGALSSALSRLLVVMENYPKLESQQGFRQLQDELAGTENRIAVERRKYNEAVQRYNTDIELFPNNIAASIFGFSKNSAYFTTEPGAREAPKVKF